MREEFSALTACQNHHPAQNHSLQNHRLHRTMGSTEPQPKQNHGLHRNTALYNKCSHKEICPVTRGSPSSWGHSLCITHCGQGLLFQISEVILLTFTLTIFSFSLAHWTWLPCATALGPLQHPAPLNQTSPCSRTPLLLSRVTSGRMRRPEAEGQGAASSTGSWSFHQKRSQCEDQRGAHSKAQVGNEGCPWALKRCRLSPSNSLGLVTIRMNENLPPSGLGMMALLQVWMS